MGYITVNGGGPQVVQYRTASGRKSKRLAFADKEQLEINDSGDQLWLDFCVFDCGAPSAGPADVVPGDTAYAYVGGFRGICMDVYSPSKGRYVFSKCTDGRPRQNF
jgi:hypothetical protein